jgi:hypothetical protein
MLIIKNIFQKIKINIFDKNYFNPCKTLKFYND